MTIQIEQPTNVVSQQRSESQAEVDLRRRLGRFMSENEVADAVRLRNQRIAAQVRKLSGG
ncbi:hypothetical protein AFFFEF_00421 [Methylorubrum extorquens]|jgi:hypothetical protein